MKNFLYVLVVFLGTAFITRMSFAENVKSYTREKSEARLEVNYDRGKISVDLKDADIEQVLEKISQTAKVKLKTGEGLTGKISRMQFEGLSVKEALERLVGGKGYGVVMEYQGPELVGIHISKKEGKFVRKKKIGPFSGLSIKQLIEEMKKDEADDPRKMAQLNQELKMRVPQTEDEVLILFAAVRDRSTRIAKHLGAHAMRSLHNIDDKKLAPILIEMLKDDERRIRNISRSKLRRLGVDVGIPFRK